MTASEQARAADVILANLAEILARLTRLEQRLSAVAEDVDALDRHNRPYGDGSKYPRGRRRAA